MYYNQVNHDILAFFTENGITMNDIKQMNICDLQDLIDKMIDGGSITGKAGESYFGSPIKAKKAVLDEIDLAILALREWGFGYYLLDGDWESVDTIVRRYLFAAIMKDILKDVDGVGFLTF